MAEIQLEGVQKTYAGSGAAAVNHLSLHVNDGEFIALLGPSGCGKSTALRMVAGLEDLTAGTIRIAGRVVNDVSPRDRDVAMVFQNYALYPQMTVAQNMAFALELRRMPRAEIQKRVMHAAQMLGLVPLLARRPRTLSGGQRQRVALGRAMVREPQCFLFDEPLSNLDANLRTETRAEIKRLHQSLAATSLYVTHDQEEAMTLADRIVVLKAGEVQQIGAPLEVYRRPANQFVAGFVGTPHMNFLEGVIDSNQGRLSFLTAAGRVVLSPSSRLLLADPLGKTVILGVRPPSVKPVSDGDAHALGARVNLVEPLGDVMHVHLELLDGQHVVAQMPADDSLFAGMPLQLAFDPDRVCLFDPGTGNSLLA
jgi:multiple sugar transport system ATP-binding protein